MAYIFGFIGFFGFRAMGFPQAIPQSGEQTVSDRTDHVRKTRTGTWLSPLEQAATQSRSQLAPPSDPIHRRFIVRCAGSLKAQIVENEEALGERLEETFARYPLLAAEDGGKGASKHAWVRSLKSLPLARRHTPPLESAIPRMKRSPVSREPYVGSLMYTWLERGELRDLAGQVVHHDAYTMQVRHHTKLEPFHEQRRPVYCINMKSDIDLSVDLRLIALLNVEIGFLEAAVDIFARPDDCFGGRVVLDAHRRVFIDEQVIRRAAFCYGQFQLDRSVLPREQRAAFDAQADQTVRAAHFLVVRAHPPELEGEREAR